MQKSCLVGLILIAAVLLAASLWLRRYLVPEPVAAPLNATPVAASTTPETEAEHPATAAPLLEDPLYEERIEGLYLETIEPLAEIPLDVRGLAAAEGRLYITAYDAATQTPWLHELDRQAGTPSRSLALPAGGEPCGLQATGPLLWTCVNSEDGAIILAVDRDAWASAPVTPITDTLRAVAQLADGSLVGVDRAGRRFYHWAVDGTLQDTATNATGALYQDCELIRGSLVCVGEVEGSGVLDVIDPYSLSLLARHQATTRTAWGALVAGNGLAMEDEAFLLVPPGGELPLLWSYRLDVSLANYVPSIAAP